MKIIDTSNLGSDYPDEKEIATNITNVRLGTVMVKALNTLGGPQSSRYYALVEDDYVLQGGFEA